jgi:hypothetical protein
MIKHSFWTFILLFSLLCADIQAQYRLPRLEVLADNGIREVVVTKTPLRMVNLKGEDITDTNFDTTTSTIKRYVINPMGKVDSLIMHPSGKDYYRLTVVRYDEAGRALEGLSFDHDKRLMGRSLIEKDSTGGLYSRNWEYGTLRSENWFSPDSITIKTLGHRSGSTSIYTYDLAEDIETERWYKDSVLMREEVLDWESDRGIPTVMHHAYYEKNEGNKKPTEWKKTFEVNAKGQVVNEYMEFFYDPFLGKNFFERHRVFKGFPQPDAGLFVLDTLESSQEQSELHTFDGDEIVYRYDFVYGK